MRTKRVIVRTPANAPGIAELQRANQLKQMGREGNQRVQEDDHTLSDRIAKLERLAFPDRSNFMTVNARGQIETDLSKCTPHDMDLLAQFTMSVRKMPGAYQEVIVTSGFRMKDSLKALDELGTYLGMGKKGAKSRRGSVV